jgi:hypothetical protein
MKSTLAMALLLCTASATLAATGPGTMIQSNDEVGLTYPLWVQSDTTGLTWNNGSIGSTYGRMIRLQDLALGGPTSGFYDLGIDHAGNFFVTIQANPTKSFLIAPGGAATFTSTLRVGDSVSTGGNVSVGGSLNVSGQVNIHNLPVAPAGAKHLMVDSAGNLYVEP